MNKKNQGSALIIVLTFITVLSFLGASFLLISTTDSRNGQRQVENQKAFFLAEAGLKRAAWRIKEDTADSLEAYTVTPYSETFQLKGSGTSANTLEDENIAITISYDSTGGVYNVTSASQFGNSTKTLNSIDIKNSQGKVFDYSYFINNWGWFYGGPIYSYGDVRSNGRFDFAFGPTVNGDIYSAYEIGINGTINGYGNQTQYQHSYSKGIEMPNINDLTYYESKAKDASSPGTVVIDGATVIDGVYGDDPAEKQNIVLVGTAAKPIYIDGTVVIRGDAVISGYITGQGTIYCGRNMYVPNNIRYSNPPTTNRPTYPVDAPPASSTIDTWVSDNSSKDLVGFAAKGSVIMGDYTNPGNQWIYNSYLYHMGDEDVGWDGIPDTDDEDGTEEDGIFDTQFEDLDEDGVKDNDYTSTDVATQDSITNFANVPSGFTTYAQIATNPDTYTAGSSTVEGIFYTNHAIAGTPGACTINGAIISKDESLGVNSLTMNYDWRVNSKYASGNNKIIDLPYSKKVEILRWWE